MDKCLEEKICDLYLNNLTMYQISDIVDKSASYVYKILTSNNIVRSKSETQRTRADKKRLNYDFFKVIDSEEKSYWAGFIYADGNVSIGSRSIRLSIEISNKDIDHLRKIGYIFNEKIKERTRYGRATCYIKISNVTLGESLIKLGILPNKSHEEKCDVFEKIPNNLLNHFIRGVFDGDGCAHLVSGKYKRIEFSGNIFFIEKLKQYFLDKKLTINNKIKANKNQNACICWSSNPSVQNIYNFMYSGATIFLERKREILEVKINENTK